MDKSREIKAGANFSAIALISLRFNSINFHLHGVGVTTNIEKVKDLNTGVADADKPGTRTADLEEVDGVEVDKAEADGADVPGTDIANPAKAKKADKPGTDIANLVIVDGADESGTGIEDRVDKLDTGSATKDS